MPQLQFLTRCPLILALVFVIGSAASGSLWSAQDPSDPRTKATTDAQVFKKTLVPSLLSQLVRASRDDPSLRALVSRIQVELPADIASPWTPSAYAVPGANNDIIVVDVRYLDQVTSAAIIGGILVSDLPARAGLIANLERDYKARRASLGGRPELRWDVLSIAKYKHALSPLEIAQLEQVRGMIFWDAFVWVMLHEAGHHALGHRTRPETLVESRERELAADAWAHAGMQRLGYGLFGVAQFLAGLATLEEWNAGAPTLGGEGRSTHPTWATRLTLLRGKYEVEQAVYWDFLSCFSPQPLDMSTGILTYFVIPRPSARSSTGIIIRNNQGGHAGVEWKGTTVVLYTRQPGGTREEITIRGTEKVIGQLELRIFDQSGKVLKEDAAPTFQQSRAIIEEVPLVGDLTFGEVLKRVISNDILRLPLPTLGVSSEKTELVLKAGREWDEAREAMMLTWYKGQLSAEEIQAKVAARAEVYTQQLTTTLGRQTYDHFVALMEKDPIMELGQAFLAGQSVQFAKEKLDEWFNP